MIRESGGNYLFEFATTSRVALVDISKTVRESKVTIYDGSRICAFD